MPNWCYCKIELYLTHNIELLKTLTPDTFVDSDNLTEYTFPKINPKADWDCHLTSENCSGIKIFGQYMFDVDISSIGHKYEITSEIKWGPINSLPESVIKYCFNNNIECEMYFAEPAMDYCEMYKLERLPILKKELNYIRKGLKNNEPLIENLICKYIQPLYKPLKNINVNFQSDDFDEDKKYWSGDLENSDDEDNFYHNNRYSYLLKKYPEYPDLAEIWGMWE